MSKQSARFPPSRDDVYNLCDSVLVVGSGAAGIQASMDLARLGFKAVLVEKEKNIGGLIAKLDKTYATNDCASSDILYHSVFLHHDEDKSGKGTIENAWARKCLQMEHGACGKCHLGVNVYNNPNIEVLANTEVTNVEYLDDGNIKVTLEKRILGIDEEKCINCGECYNVCPVRFDEDWHWFDAGLNTRRAVNIPFVNAIPPVYTIEEDKCLYMIHGLCSRCQDVCPTNAVTFEFKIKTIVLTVGSIIFATGARQAPTTAFDKFLGKHLDVLNALQFERLASPNGPTGGNIIKPSNRKPAKRIAFVQCVGSRNCREGAVPYCSTVCCMYAIKEADMVKEWDPTAECYIFNVENRAYLKGFHEYYLRAKHNHGVNFIQGRVASVRGNNDNFDLTLEFEDISTGSVQTMDVDMVVLSTALIPNNETIANILGIPLNKYHYFDKTMLEELEYRGVFFAGFALRPMDIPSSIITGDAAVAKVARRQYHTLKSKLEPPQFLVDELHFYGEPRIGVLVCQCSKDAIRILDNDKIINEIKSLPGVVAVESRLFDSCEAAQERVRKMIKDHGLNRVVVGGCSPRIYGSSFRKAVERAGMDSFLLEMVNTREHATWVHQDDPPGATSKVIDLVAMGVAKTRELVFDERKQIPMTKAVLIIGGGPSGIIAADNLASQDIKVYLVERESRLGGAINKISRKFLLEDEEIYIGKLEHIIDRFPKNPNVEVLTNSQVTSVNGFVGNFQVIIESAGKTRQIKVGCIIVATGATQSNDFSNIIMAPSPRVFNQEHFERLLVEGNIGDFKRIGFIQCSNQRVDGKISSNFKNCSGICCKISLKQAIKIHDLNPDAEIHIMQRGMQLSGEVYNEDYHHKVQRFACIERYDPDDYPRVVPGEKGVQVSFKERNTGADLVLDLDAVVLATPYLSASGTEKLAAMLKVPLMQAGFFLEAHVKFRPNDFVVDGMFLAGDAHWPKTLIDAVAHGLGAAARASGFLSKGYINTEENVAEVDLETCIGCGKCADACPFGAISMVSIPIEIEGITIEHQKAHVNEVLCKACGTCVGGCPSFAIDQRNIRKNQLSAMIHALFPQPINKT